MDSIHRTSHSHFGQMGLIRPATFFIGNKAINYSVYIKEKSEAHIFLIESSALDDLTKSPTDLRDRSVVRFNPETVSNIAFKREAVGSSAQSSTVNCEKRGSTWHVTSPIEAKADAQEIERILSELLLLQVVTFEADAANTLAPLRINKIRIRGNRASKSNSQIQLVPTPLTSARQSQQKPEVQDTSMSNQPSVK